MTAYDLSEQHGKALEQLFQSILRGIDLCIGARCIHSALILIYSAIDNMAFLYMPANQQDVYGKDFRGWADSYMQPAKTLGCSADELYSARCGIVHSLMADSRHTREKGVRKVFYAWGNKPSIPQGASRDWVMIKVEELANILRKGIASFFSDINKDKILEQRVLPRLKKLLVDPEYLKDNAD